MTVDSGPGRARRGQVWPSILYHFPCNTPQLRNAADFRRPSRIIHKPPTLVYANERVAPNDVTHTALQGSFDTIDLTAGASFYVYVVAKTTVATGHKFTLGKPGAAVNQTPGFALSNQGKHHAKIKADDLTDHGIFGDTLLANTAIGQVISWELDGGPSWFTLTMRDIDGTLIKQDAGGNIADVIFTPDSYAWVAGLELYGALVARFTEGYPADIDDAKNWMNTQWVAGHRAPPPMWRKRKI